MPVEMTPAVPVVVVREPGRTALHLVLREPLDIGRDGPGLLIDDPGVSRNHLQLRPTDDGVVVVDLGSSNGTLLDGERLTEPTRLRAGSVVVLGGTTVELLPESAPTIAAEPAERSSIEQVASSVTTEQLPPPSVLAVRGTVTIVFTDIESSTALSTAMGDKAWFDLLARHNEVIRARVKAHGGIEIKSQGDGFMLAFESGYRALRAMEEAQLAIAEGLDGEGPPIRIRVGAHTGEAIADDRGDIFGYHVNLAARIANAALGGEILVSSLLKEIVDPRGEFSFGEARTEDLKGLGTYLVHPVAWR